MVDRLTQEYEGRIEFRLYDVDKDTEGSRLMQQFRATAVPTFVFVGTDGAEVARRIGAPPEDELRELLDALVE